MSIERFPFSTKIANDYLARGIEDTWLALQTPEMIDSLGGYAATLARRAEQLEIMSPALARAPDGSQYSYIK